MLTRRNFVEKTLGLLALPGLLSSFSYGHDIAGQDDLARIQAILANKEPVKWVFAGDSITQGARHTFGYRSYPEIFAERVRWELKRVRDIVINSAISGNVSGDILKDFEWRVAQFSPAVVFIMIGTNDANEKRNLSTEQFRENLLQLVAKVRSGNGIPVLQTPNIIITEKAVGRERLKDYIPMIREVAMQTKCILVDHWAFWEGKALANPDLVYKKWLNDELHPNGRGHDEMAKLLFKELSIFDPASFTGSEHWLNS
jgi:lysophospholipase L1-like esterase